MEIMRRYEGRLARLEKFVRERRKWLEAKRMWPERLAKWQALLAHSSIRQNLFRFSPPL